MRGASSLGSLALVGIVGISSAALTAVDVANASANSWDTRTGVKGCAPDACTASNAIDGSVEYDSRWSCLPGYFDDFGSYYDGSYYDASEPCELTLALGEPQDIQEIRVALWKGDERKRLFNVLADGQIVTTIESSGTTEGYEPYQVSATQASTIVLQAPSSDNETYSGWLSILEVEVMVGSNLAVSPPSPAPTDVSYAGCFNDMIDDRIMSTVMTIDDLTPETCWAACRELHYVFYALQQGNECWCAGCDLTDGGTGTAYDRHGSGSCLTVCTGDSSSQCGGDMTFSLFLAGNCGPTPAPTVALFDTACPGDSTPFALQITLTSSADPELTPYFQVTEPSGIYPSSGFYPSYDDGIENIGVITRSSDETVITYTTRNGLSDDAPVVGDYLVVIDSHESVPYALTARVAGEIVLETQGVTTPGVSDQFTITVTEYAESDCKIEEIGVCPRDTFSSDGAPPCITCADGRSAAEGATICRIGAFDHIDVSDEVVAAILADAVGGFAGPLGLSDLTGHGDTYSSNSERFYHITAEDGGTLNLTGTFWFQDSYAFPPSTALKIYIDTEGVEGLLLDQGSFDLSTREFSIIVEDFPSGTSTVFFSFPVLDPDQTAQYFGLGTVFYADVAHSDWISPLTISLEWDIDVLGYYWTDDNWYQYLFDLYVQEPDGNFVGPEQTGSFGYSSTFGAGAMAYSVYGGIPCPSGVYVARLLPTMSKDVAFNLTAEVNGLTVWVEEGMFYGAEVFDLSFYVSHNTTSASLLGDFNVTLDCNDAGTPVMQSVGTRAPLLYHTQLFSLTILSLLALY